VVSSDVCWEEEKFWIARWKMWCCFLVVSNFLRFGFGLNWSEV
jgi:hypothetical protein